MTPVSVTLWNAAGWLTWHLGRGAYGLGLALCGFSGYLDARADAADFRAWEQTR